MSEFKNNALGEALKGRMKKIVLNPGPQEGHPDKARDERLLTGKENSPRPTQKSK